MKERGERKKEKEKRQTYKIKKNRNDGLMHKGRETKKKTKANGGKERKEKISR